MTDAWEQACFARERREVSLGLAIGLVFFPGYAVIDRLLEPGLELAPYRLVGGLMFLAALVIARSARSVRTVRWALVLGLGTSPLVAAMYPQVDHFWTYLTGFTGYIWGSMITSVPMRFTLGLIAWHLCSAIAGMAMAPQLHAADHLGAGFMLAMVTCVTVAACHARLHAIRAAFDQNRMLERAMAELGDAQARLVAQEKMSALGRMLAGLSHEINNPMNIIKNNLDPVREHLEVLTGDAAVDEADRAWRREDLDDALRSMGIAVAHIQQVHGDLRAFIRGDAREKKAIDINDGLRATVGLLKRHVPPAVEVDLRLGDVQLIACHPGELNQVWLNLVQNALDAVGGKGRIVVASRAVREDLVEVRVTDDGPGISPDFRARLFEPFATTKDPGHGTGLGLATSYQIVQRHGGRIFVDDTHVGGASFAVELPVRSTA